VVVSAKKGAEAREGAFTGDGVMVT
jgi:hypothetical protein